MTTLSDHWPCGHERTPENTFKQGCMNRCARCFKAYQESRKQSTAERNADLVAQYRAGFTYRELQGAFGIAYSTVYNILADAGELPSQAPKYRISQVIAATAWVTGISVEDIRGKSRFKRICRARQAAMFIAREAGNGFSAIGRAFGGKDHSTVIHACEKVPIYEMYETGYSALLRAIRRILEGHKPEAVIEPVIAPTVVKKRNDFRANEEDRDSGHEFHRQVARDTVKLAKALLEARA